MVAVGLNMRIDGLAILAPDVMTLMKCFGARPLEVATEAVEVLMCFRMSSYMVV